MPHVDHHLVAGTAGGVITALLLHPLDLVKVRLQVQDGRTVATRYKGVLSAISSITKTEGLVGFYRGVVPAMWGSGASWGLYFYFYESCKRRMLANARAEAERSSQSSSFSASTAISSGPGRPARSTSDESQPPRLSVSQNLYAAWEGGTITCFFTNPLWLVKTRLQLQTNAPTAPVSGHISGAAAAAAANAAAVDVSHHRAYRGMLHALATIVREEGALGLYRGLFPALLLVSHGMVQFAVYEELKRLIARLEGRHSNDRLDSSAITSAANSNVGGGSAHSSYRHIGNASDNASGSVLQPSAFINHDRLSSSGSHGLLSSRSAQQNSINSAGSRSSTTNSSDLAASVMQGVSHSTALFAAGAASKAVATTVTYPYQVIKSRLQQRFLGPEHERPYKGFADTVRKILTHEGPRGFYKGFGANLLRVAPQSAVTLVAYENALAALDALDK